MTHGVDYINAVRGCFCDNALYKFMVDADKRHPSHTHHTLAARCSASYLRRSNNSVQVLLVRCLVRPLEVDLVTYDRISCTMTKSSTVDYITSVHLL